MKRRFNGRRRGISRLAGCHSLNMLDFPSSKTGELAEITSRWHWDTFSASGHKRQNGSARALTSKPPAQCGKKRTMGHANCRSRNMFPSSRIDRIEIPALSRSRSMPLWASARTKAPMLARDHGGARRPSATERTHRPEGWQSLRANGHRSLWCTPWQPSIIDAVEVTDRPRSTREQEHDGSPHSK